MSTVRVSFNNRDGDRLAALLDLPVDGEPVAYALFAHCFTCSKDYKGVTRVSRALARQGVAVLRFDFTGLGESEGDFSSTTFSSNIEDLVSAADHLSSELAPPALLIGHSLGGAAVIKAAERIPSARAVATIAAPSSPAHLLRYLEPRRDEIERRGEAEIKLAGRPFRIRRQLLDDISQVSMRQAIEGLGKALLVLHSPADTVVGIDNASELFVTARHPKSFVSLDRADHLLSDPEDAAYAGAIIAAWARKYVGGPQDDAKQPLPGDDRVVARIGGAGYRTELLANGHPLVADEPASAGGSNAGPSPYELLSSALGACTVMTLRVYADRKQWPLDAAEARVHHGKTHCDDCQNPDDRSSRIDRFERELRLVGPLDDSQRRRLLEIADRCPVHRTLHSKARIVTTLVE